MSYVIGIDLGTSAVKILLVSKAGTVTHTISKAYPLIQHQSGFSEQEPSEWVTQTINALAELVQTFPEESKLIEGISFSGQMHGLVLLDEHRQVLRPAILWNDTRTTAQCKRIQEIIGKEELLSITKNPILEGFTLPKLLWVRDHEPDVFRKAATFLLPKDYLRYALTGTLQCEYSDAGGTSLLDIEKQTWSQHILSKLELDPTLCPPLVTSHEVVGCLTASVAKSTGLSDSIKVMAGGADNACGAIGAGILTPKDTLVSIGTSGVVLAYEQDKQAEANGKVHFFHHAKPEAFYKMGVTLSAGYSLSWFKDTFATEEDIGTLIEEAGLRPAGAKGLLFSPYLSGERTPHADAAIRASFIGMSSTHTRADFTRAVLEGITFSLKDSVELFREEGIAIDRIVSIGGGARSEVWLQMQADIFNCTIVKLTSEQGPGMGAAMLAAYGLNWFDSLEDCAAEFLQEQEVYNPDPVQVQQYDSIYKIYRSVYQHTKEMNQALSVYR
ncbi:xylulokinase [Alkalicoccobacillus porphyridii]|uniref:Xylulose kinase n=1 Tax=Alkalicoccobacillus porphyridii TaxID=2597270 RepID=A0A553ZZW4_9BACI|nr:xylulokinase [Alkalicoccobacillus porphyridii]TSB46988.1 xylulokinase [Alkalicoccobacillus porphyridii]